MFLSALLVLGIAGGVAAPGTAGSPTAQQGPDVSGRWSRESVSGQPDGFTWGTRVQIDQSGANLIVRPDPGKPQEFRLDGTETAEVIEVKGACSAKVRITKATAAPGRLTITTWLIVKGVCVHGEDEDNPMFPSTGPIQASEARGGPRRLESITVIYRDGNLMTVETTSAAPGGLPSTTTTTYRK